MFYDHQRLGRRLAHGSFDLGALLLLRAAQAFVD